MHCGCNSCVVFALLQAQCTVCKSYVVFALLPEQCAVCVSPVLCLHYCHAAQCAVCVSPMLCLHYCQRSVLCVKSCVVFVQFTASAVCRAGAMTSPLTIIYFAIFYCTTASAVCCVLCLHYCQCSVLCV